MHCSSTALGTGLGWGVADGLGLDVGDGVPVGLISGEGRSTMISVGIGEPVAGAVRTVEAGVPWSESNLASNTPPRMVKETEMTTTIPDQARWESLPLCATLSIRRVSVSGPSLLSRGR
jgi:hypothetical protein